MFVMKLTGYVPDFGGERWVIEEKAMDELVKDVQKQRD